MAEMGSKLVSAKAGMPSFRVTRPKDGMISQKSGHRSIFLTLSHRQPLLFDAKLIENIHLQAKTATLYFHHRKTMSYQFN